MTLHRRYGDVELTSCACWEELRQRTCKVIQRCINVDVTLYKRHMPTGLERPVEIETDKFRLFAHRLHNPLNFSVGYNAKS